MIRLLGAAAAWPIAARGQPASPLGAIDPSKLPLVGFLNSASPETYRFNANSFREGLAQAGFHEGRNVRIEERWANADYQLLPALALELVAKGVVVIAATGDVASARAAQAASRTVPVVFTIGGDPVRLASGEPQPARRQCDRGVLLSNPAGGKARADFAGAGATSVAHRLADELKQPQCRGGAA